MFDIEENNVRANKRASARPRTFARARAGSEQSELAVSAINLR